MRQAAAATRLIEGSLSAEVRGFISMVTLVEVAWVMASNYRLGPPPLPMSSKGC